MFNFFFKRQPIVDKSHLTQTELKEDTLRLISKLPDSNDNKQRYLDRLDSLKDYQLIQLNRRLEVIVHG